MRVLLLHCHPLEDSYSASLRDRAVAALGAGGADVDVHRLAAGDDPDLDALGGVDALVLVYPTWWGGLPAPLLSWIQRRLGPWVDGHEPKASSPLRSVRHVRIITSHGSSQLINRAQGEPGRQLLQRPVASLCAPQVDFRWISLYKLDRAEPDDFTTFDRLVDDLMTELAAET